MACYHSVHKRLSSRRLSNLKIRIYKSIIFPVVLYGCETWSLTLREEHRVRAFENRVLKKIFGSKTDEVIGVGSRDFMCIFGDVPRKSGRVVTLSQTVEVITLILLESLNRSS
jgi:hypothetical protein